MKFNFEMCKYYFYNNNEEFKFHRAIMYIVEYIAMIS